MADISYLASSRFKALTIMRVRARPLDLPLSTPIATAQATLTTAPLVLVDGQTDQRIVGPKRQGHVDRTARVGERPLA
jgi:hypothetical protein